MGIPFAPFLALGALIALFAGRRAARRVPEPPSSAQLLKPAFCRYLVRGIRWTSSGPTSSGCPARPEPATTADAGDGSGAAAAPLRGQRDRRARRRPDRGHRAVSRATGSRPSAAAPSRAARSRRRSLDEGVASREGIARTLASRFQLPFVDLAADRRRRGGGQGVPIHVLERVVAAPVRARGRRPADRGRRPRQRARDRRAAARDALTSSSSASPRARTSWPRSAASPAPPRPSAPAPRSTRTRLVEEAEEDERRPRGRRRHLRRRRSSGSSTRSSSRRPRTAPATSTSSRRRTRSPSGSASTACCTRCSGSRSG